MIDPKIATVLRTVCDELAALNDADDWEPIVSAKAVLRRRIAELSRYRRYEPAPGCHDNTYCFFCGRPQSDHDCQFSRDVAQRIEIRR